MPEYTREQLRKLLINLPEDIKEILSASETQDVIFKILEENDILDERATRISALIRNVLYGLLLPEDFKKSLKKESELEDETVNKMFHEINRFVFFPVKQSLASLYKIETTTEKAKPEPTQVKASEPIESVKSDSYLEQIER